MTISFFRKFSFWLIVAYAMGYAFIMIALGGGDINHLYAHSSYHRLQADALLHGHLYIGTSTSQLAHDLAWYDGQVNQVWGLGVGLWLVPFEIAWRALGQEWFPDRIAFGVALALLALYAGGTALILSRQFKSVAFGLGFVWLIICCPALWTLNDGPQLIYEETSLYACLVSLAILMACIRFAYYGKKRDFFICSILSGFVVLVRPTHGIYGLAGIVVCSGLLLMRRSYSFKYLLTGVIIYASGLVFLAFTNLSRFGSPAEFGHRLTVSPDFIIYTTRFANPMADATAFEATRELLGFLFLAGNPARERKQGEPMAPGEAPYYRWRQTYVSTFDPAWFLICAAGIFGGGWWITRQWRLAGGIGSLLKEPKSSVLVMLWLWALIGAGGAAMFYMRVATFCSRYLLDFAPAFTALAMLVWWLVPRRWALVGSVAMACWLGCEIVTNRILSAAFSPLNGSQIDKVLPRSGKGRGLSEYGGTYNLRNTAFATDIPYNSYGWDYQDGHAGHLVILVVDKPEFVELVMTPRAIRKGAINQTDRYRAMINGRFLPEPQVWVEEGKVTVRFELTPDIRKRNGDELLFLWFGAEFTFEEQYSERILYSVRWRGPIQPLFIPPSYDHGNE